MSASAFKTAEFNLGYSVISAPRDGVVLRKLVEEHELVPAGAPVLLFGEAIAATWCAPRCPTASCGRSTLAIRPWSARCAPGRELSGSVSERGGAADPATGLFPIEVRLVPADVALASGLVASLRLQPAAAGASLARIPAGAIVEADGGRASVFVLDGDRARRRDVQIAFLDGDQVALRAGLTRANV